MYEAQENRTSHNQNFFFSRRTVFGEENKIVQKHKNLIQQYFMGKHFIFSFRARGLEDHLCQEKGCIL